mgnify:CR=1 FL=1
MTHHAFPDRLRSSGSADAAASDQSTGTCLFCGIASNKVPSATVHSDGDIHAFLDINPIRPGHVLIIPRAHYPYFDDLPPGLALRITTLGQKIARSLKALYGVPRVAFLFTGGDIPHVHAHVVPLVEGTDITSRRYIAEPDLTFRNTPRADDAELAETAARIRAALAGR